MTVPSSWRCSWISIWNSGRAPKCRRSRREVEENVAKMLWRCLVSVSFLIVSVHSSKDNVSYKYVEFPYKETTKNELAFKEFESACEQTPACTLKTGVARTACVRECISPSCHQELYAQDPLEEGEIDVRLNSFKGCFTQRWGRPRQ